MGRLTPTGAFHDNSAFKLNATTKKRTGQTVMGTCVPGVPGPDTLTPPPPGRRWHPMLGRVPISCPQDTEKGRMGHQAGWLRPS